MRWIYERAVALVIAGYALAGPTVISFGGSEAKPYEQIVGIECESPNPLAGFWFVDPPGGERVTGAIVKTVLTGIQKTYFVVPENYPMDDFGFVLYADSLRVVDKFIADRGSSRSQFFLFDYIDHQDVRPFFNQNSQASGRIFGIPFTALLGLAIALVCLVYRVANQSGGKKTIVVPLAIIAICMFVYVGNQFIRHINRIEWASWNFAGKSGYEKAVRYSELLVPRSGVVAEFIGEMPEEASFFSDLESYYSRIAFPYLGYPRINIRKSPDYYIARDSLPAGYEPIESVEGLTLGKRASVE